jgi:hypothetical protein
LGIAGLSLIAHYCAASTGGFQGPLLPASFRGAAPPAARSHRSDQDGLSFVGTDRFSQALHPNAILPMVPV